MYKRLPGGLSIVHIDTMLDRRAANDVPNLQ